ncbi:MAG: cupin domain-containing protein [Polyangia bacterium]
MNGRSVRTASLGRLAAGAVGVASALALLSARATPSPGALVPVAGASASAPTYEIAAGKGQATLLLNPGTGSPEAALSRLVLRGGAQVPEHVHEHSAELLYVVRGEIVVHIEARAIVLKAGDAVRIPAGQKHAGSVPPAIEQAELVQIYVGPGPEQRFTAGRRLDSRR